MFKKLNLFFKLYGVVGGIRAIVRKILKPKRACYSISKQWRCFSVVDQLISGKSGLEIGGPSPLFSSKGWLPLYPIVGSLDNCNFSSTTIWEGTIQGGLTFTYDPKHNPGRQYILEITDLKSIMSESYDFVISSHALEHSANPLKALLEMMRVMKKDGGLVLVFPHMEGTFDHRRPVTTIDHLIEDYHHNTTEEDLTHLPEILSSHDLTRDPWAGGYEAFKTRSERNFENRCLHQHVFDTKLAAEVVNWLGMQIILIEPARPYHIFVVARKVGGLQTADNGSFLGAGALFRKQSPFAADRVHR